MTVKKNNETVLIVEDERFLSELLVRKLTKNNYNVLYTTDGSKALETLQNNHVDIVLLDILLPGISGFDVLSAMKKNPKIKNVSVLVLSNLGGKEEIAKAKELGADDYIVKAHSDLNEIAMRVRLTLDAKS